MPKWTTELIASQLEPGEFTPATQAKLERTRSNIEPVLIQLLRHNDAFVREVAATILGERRSPHSIPALIRAVSDPSEHVGFDAVVAIEKCAGLDTGELTSSLYLDLSKPREGARRLAAWWRIVREHVLP